MRIEKDNKKGFILHTEFSSVVYKNIGDFHEDMAKVQNENGYGYINSQGVEVIPCQFEEASDFKESYATVLKGGIEKWGFIDKIGNELLPFIYDSAGDFGEGLVAVCTDHFLGYIDTLGNHVIEVENKYFGLSEFSEGMAKVWTMSYIKKDEIDKVPSEFEIFDEDLNIYISFKYGYINKLAEETIPLQFSKCEPFVRGKAKVVRGGKEGFINKEGKEIIPIMYDKIGEFSEGTAVIFNNGLWGIIHEAGEVIIQCHYESLEELIKVYSQSIAKG